MGFIKSAREIAGHRSDGAEFDDAEVLTVFFLTRPEVSAGLLPPPLKPAAVPTGFVFLANYPKTSFGVSYLESALFLMAEFNGEPGAYCLSMPVTNDFALILGREIFGFPKKIGDIHFSRQDKEAGGWTERHGVRILDVRVRLTGKFNDVAAQQMMGPVLQSDQESVIYNHKYFQAPSLKGFDYNPRLVRQVVKRHRASVDLGEAKLQLQSSDHDPWGDVEIVRVLGAAYTRGNSTLLPGDVVAEVDPVEFAPYAFMKVDSAGAAAAATR